VKRLGPELKMPDLKVPTFLADVYWDLRERRLLPLIGLVVVAIVSVPFLLGDQEEAAIPPLAAGVGAAGAGAAKASSLTVVEAQPGLRDYRKRLRGRSATDPFAQRFTAPQLKGSELNDAQLPGGESGEGSGGGAGAGEKSGGGKATGGGSGKGGDGSDGGSLPPSSKGDEAVGTEEAEAEGFSGTIDVKIVRSGGATPEAVAESEQAKSIFRRHVQPQVPLPGPNLPVFRYMGPSRESKGNRPLLLVSSEVHSVFGDSRCVAGEEACQLLEVEPGLPVTFVYGPAEIHYTVTVLKIYP
jgi:hypothetical protein